MNKSASIYVNRVLNYSNKNLIWAWNGIDGDMKVIISSEWLRNNQNLNTNAKIVEFFGGRRQVAMAA